MAGICEGHWIKSLIKTADDGTIDIKQKTGGLLEGKHNKSQKGIFGICIESPGSLPHVTFVRFLDGKWFIYEGDIERVTTPVEKFKITGTVTVVPAAKTKEAPRADDWTAEKPT